MNLTAKVRKLEREVGMLCGNNSIIVFETDHGSPGYVIGDGKRFTVEEFEKYKAASIAAGAD